MTITLNPRTEAKLLEKAHREGHDPEVIANDVLWDFLTANAQEAASRPVASILPPEQPGEDPRMAILREIDARSQFMNPKPNGRDFLREGRDGGMFGE